MDELILLPEDQAVRLDYARRIQPSMLLRADPDVAGLDLASVSLPANDMADLWNFKGDAEQVDDITLVVLKAC